MIAMNLIYYIYFNRYRNDNICPYLRNMATEDGQPTVVTEHDALENCGSGCYSFSRTGRSILWSKDVRGKEMINSSYWHTAVFMYI